MGVRAQQRERTRRRIVRAATRAFAARGFEATSTRDVAKLAGVNQGLITYYFGSKELLWKAAIAEIFAAMEVDLLGQRQPPPGADVRTVRRELLKGYVRFVARHPELLRIMIEEGNTANERLDWLIETYLRPAYEAFTTLSERDARLETDLLPHLFYIVAGASSLIFTVRNECRRLTGVDPATDEAIEAHAELLARLLVP